VKLRDLTTQAVLRLLCFVDGHAWRYNLALDIYICLRCDTRRSTAMEKIE
jgi:hypothetical protein